MHMRQVYKLSKELMASWYPRHMAKSMREMQAKLRLVDIIIEVHDARIPLTGRNPNFGHLLGVKPRILVYNKKDLIDDAYQKKIIDAIIANEKDILKIVFTSANDPNGASLKDFIPLMIDYSKNYNRYNRTGQSEINIMVIGVPNVGKSSLLNSLRNKYFKRSKATPEGPYAGVTKSVMNKIKIYSDPKIYVIDTPGIMVPHLKNPESMMRLALCATYKDSLIGEERICDYMLYWLNKRKLSSNYTQSPALNLPPKNEFLSEILKTKNLFKDMDQTQLILHTNRIKDVYTSYFSSQPTDDHMDFLIRVAIANMHLQKVRKLSYGKEENLIGSVNFDDTYELKPNLNEAANFVLKKFRSGQMGKYMLDDDLL